MTAKRFEADPLEPSHQVCPSSGIFHHFVPAGPMNHRVLRCGYCNVAESTIRRALKEAADAQQTQQS